MIAIIKGKILHKSPSFIVLDTGNIGYEVKISLNTYDKIKDKDECILYTHLQIKEDSHTLYGFLSQAEKNSFLLLISVKGVGPSVSLAILSTINTNDLITAIATENISLIKSIKGVGIKMAQRIVLELKDKIAKMADSNICTQNNLSGISKIRDEGLAALIKLGIPKPMAEKSINEIIKKEGHEIDIETLLKLALTTI